MTRTKPCARDGCRGLATERATYCSRSCACAVTRARQTPEQRHRIAMVGRQAQRKEEIERLLARVRLAETERGRILLAYTLGKRASKSARYRAKEARHEAA